MVLVQHSCSNIDEVQIVGAREHPVLAVWAVELPMRAMQTANYGFATRNREAITRHGDGQ
jgi:hypothetical protein